MRFDLIDDKSRKSGYKIQKGKGRQGMAGGAGQ